MMQFVMISLCLASLASFSTACLKQKCSCSR